MGVIAADGSDVEPRLRSSAVVVHGSLLPQSLAPFAAELGAKANVGVDAVVRASHQARPPTVWLDVQQLADKLEEREHLSIVFGHSLGALVAAAAVALRGGAVETLVLYEPPFVVGEYDTPSWMTVREQDPVTAFLHHVLGPDVRNSAVDGVSGALGSARRRWSSMEAARLLGLEERWRATVTERVLLAWLCKAHGTILVVTGEASPTRYHLRAERLQDALGSKCETVTLHGAGHAGPLSHASELAILLADALGARAESR